MGAVYGCGKPSLQEAKSSIDERFGGCTSEAMQSLADLLGRVDVTITGQKSTGFPYLLSLGMIMKQVEQERRYAKPMTSGTSFTDAKVLKKAARYARYAAAATTLHDRRTVLEHVGGLEPEDLVIVAGSEPGTNSGLLVASDPETNDVVVAIGGSDSTAQSLAGVACIKESFLGGNAHSGSVECARSISKCVQDRVVKLLQDNPRKGFAVVGYGLGGSAAVYVMALLCSEGSPLARLVAANKVRCFAFGSPPSFEPLWALPPWVQASTYTFVYNMDCVPRACLGTLGKLLLAVREVDKQPMTEQQRIVYLRGEFELPQTCPDHVELPSNLQEMIGSLYCLGTIVTLYRGGDGKMRCETCAPTMLDRLLLHPDMASDHFITAYEMGTAAAYKNVAAGVFCC